MTFPARDVTARSAGAGMPQKRASVIAQRIVKDIRRRNLPPGTQLPPERDMLLTYNVGRNTLREALRVLELQGVLTIRPGPGGGPVVASPDSRHLASTLTLLMQFADTPFRTVVGTQQLLEPMTARLCAERRDPDVLADLRRSVDQMALMLDDREAFLEEDRRFHGLIAWGSENALFGYCINSLHWITDGTALGAPYPRRFRKLVWQAHEEVCRSIESGVGIDAEAAMRKHMDDTRAYFERHYQPLMDEVLTWEMYGI
ncbi:MAG TPA: FCD domain-containing protein [Sporichthyaceae bacterium]|jgi:DNA-binding FadR family transcriptional regulator